MALAVSTSSKLEWSLMQERLIALQPLHRLKPGTAPASCTELEDYIWKRRVHNEPKATRSSHF
jgi:hypothetical protein